MKLKIRLPAGYFKEYECQPNETIKNIKLDASSTTNIDPIQLTIVYEGRKLDDSSTVEGCNLTDGTILVVMVIPTA